MATFCGISQLNFRSGSNQRCFLVCALFALLLITTQPALAAKFINVKSAPYNAQGNGITDDSAAIQAAVDAAAASPGSTVFFPPGNYLHSSSITVNGTSTTLRGFSRKSILTGAPITLSVSAAGSSLNTLTIIGVGILYYNYTVISNANKSSIVNCSVEGQIQGSRISDFLINKCDLYGANNRLAEIGLCNRVAVTNSTFRSTSPLTNNCILVGNSSNVTIRGCHIYNERERAISIESNDKVLVESNLIRGEALVAQGNTNLTIRNNHLSFTSGRNNNAGITVGTTNNSLVSNNKISGFPNDGVWLFRCGQTQIVRNQINNVNIHGINLESNANANVIGNVINGTGGAGIQCINYRGGSSNFTIQQNLLRNCGLNSTIAVIHANSTLPAGYPVTVKNNIYTGNQQNIQYFIRCVPPSPPAVVKGNITNTLLPTLVGP
jgi:hypothetical protein